MPRAFVLSDDRLWLHLATFLDAVSSLNISVMLSTVFSKSVTKCVVGRRLGHTVRVILTQDIDGGEGYAGDVMRVKAGYARNKLIPHKQALYATPENFKRLGMTDPDSETMEERLERLQRETKRAEEGGEEMKQADLLRYYLRNKVVRLRLEYEISFVYTLV